MTDTWVHQQVRRIRSELDYKHLQVKEFRPKYAVTRHDDGDTCITLDEYEKTKKINSKPPNVSSPPSLDWCEKDDMKEIVNKYAVKRQRVT